MLRVMVFIDYQNFNINLREHCNRFSKTIKSIDFCKLGKEINKQIPFSSEVIKTYLFAYKPCDSLMKLERYTKYYDWLTEIKKTNYLEVIEGRQEVRPIDDSIPIDINNPKTYRTEEKETDINLATHMLSKAFQNAYDIAILVTGDTDYIKVVETLHNIGKTVVIAHFQHQNVTKYDGISDAKVILFDSILSNVEYKKRKNKSKTK